MISVLIAILLSFLFFFRKIKVGDPNEASNMMGALVSKEHMAKVTSYVKLAREEGCSVLCGYGVEELQLPEKYRNGYFVRPTVITNVSDQSRLMQEEVFGPVTCIVPFKTEQEVRLFTSSPPFTFTPPSLPPSQVIERANNVQYGLSGCVWSENSGTTHRVAQALDVSTARLYGGYFEISKGVSTLQRFK